MSEQSPISAHLNRLQLGGLMVGAAAAVVCVIVGFMSHGQFFRSYLAAYLFWLGITLGSMAVLFIGHLAGGQWAFVIRRFAETAAMTLPLMIVLFGPILLGMGHLFLWTDKELLAGDAVLRHKSIWLNVPAFTLRAAIYFAVWLVIILLLRSWSLGWGRTKDRKYIRKLTAISGPGAVIYVITMTLAAIDWIMSRDPHFFSSIIGFITVVGQVLTALAFLVLMLRLFHKDEPVSATVNGDVLNDLGNLLLTFVILWTYMAFAQFLIIWMGNEREDVTWYLQRLTPAWKTTAALLLLFHFLIPFFLLLSRGIKRRIESLGVLAGLLLFMRFIDVLWMNLPSGPTALGGMQTMAAIVLDMLLPIAIGGVWMALFAWLLKRHPIVAEAMPAEQHSADYNPIMTNDPDRGLTGHS